MNIRDTLNEIGIFETNLQIEKYIDDEALLKSVSSEMPVPIKCETKTIVNNAVNKIIDMNKKNIFLLSNEITLIEKLLLHKEKIENILVCLSRNLSEEQVSNIKSNIPIVIRTVLLRNPCLFILLIKLILNLSLSA